MFKSKKDLIVDKLREYGIEIYHEDKYSDEEIIMAEGMTITCKKNEVFINFHITTRPSKSARIIYLLMKEIKNISNLYIGDDFVVDKNGNYIDGNEASNYHIENLKKKTISEFMSEQEQIFYLNNAKTYYNC